MAPTAEAKSREIILAAIQHLDHVLPAQAPIHDFVHHNTLHGFQHVPFEQALTDFTALTGIDCYLPETQFRALFKQGRINDVDLEYALQQRFGVEAQREAVTVKGRGITRQQLYRQALLTDLSAITPAQFEWQVQECGLLDGPENALWQAVMGQLDVRMADLHPEQLPDVGSEQAEDGLALSEQQQQGNHTQYLQQQTKDQLDALFLKVGDTLSLRGLVLALSGIDVLESVRPQLIRWCASLLDEGLAAWHIPHRQRLGLYPAWRQTVEHDLGPLFQEWADWQSIQSSLPDDAVDAIAQQLEAMAIPVDRWHGYLQRLALELPGWSGLINWRQTHPSYHADAKTQSVLADYLAIRLVLDRLHLNVLCREQWQCPARFDKLQGYFHKHSAEASVRLAMFSGQLPEYLLQAGQVLLHDSFRSSQDWQTLAERIRIWRLSPLADHVESVTVYNQGWRLFCLCRGLSLTAAEVGQIDQATLLTCLTRIDSFNETERRNVWLNAYEHHYRQDLLQALHANHGRGRWQQRQTRPQAQIYFCMDEREESFRRHLEELNPAIETLGVAGFFGIAMNFKALDAHHAIPLCPVVVTPVHQVDEIIQAGQESKLAAHRKGLQLADGLAYQLYQNLRRGIWAYPLLFALAPLQLLRLLGKAFWPTGQRFLEQSWQRWLVPKVATQLQIVAEEHTSLTSELPRLGFTDQEQADRVAQFFKTTGLTKGFARIVALMGHGSTSQNNPHEAAHDCGACGGRQGGPNARAFAAMANRPVVRQLLVAKGIEIPADTWFVGAQHDTCSDNITWYDLEQLPGERLVDFAAFKGCVDQADALAASERCRRFASSGKPASPKAAMRHMHNRAMDLSQVRPEFGHATNAAAFIGRRAATQGVFFDRRLFLISYDPSQDAEGSILESILLTAGPVGAGISLEYYFSSVNNERLGCGTKIPHNVTGLFGVMEGASSDLRTGLPLQMVEIHEAMRLQIVVEAKTGVLEQIYARQPALQELIGGGWVHLSAKDPGNGEIFVFQRGAGFVRWQPQDISLPLRSNSADCYRDVTVAVPPMLIEQPGFSGVAS
ncbi:MAG: DUF2309 domain-containing protein [Methylomonas sp.]|nr:MAG: DUF2309 domain-containing protein [Methylomonas sp.]